MTTPLGVHSRRLTRSRGITLFALAFLAVGSLLIVGGDPDGTGSAEPALENPAKMGDEPRLDPVVSTDEPRRELVPAADPGVLEHVSSADDMVRVQGTIVVVDSEGAEHREEDGELTLMVLKGDSGTGEDVTVQKGRFSTDLPAGYELAVSRAVLGSRDAHVPREPIPVSETVEFRATWSRSTILRVVDAELGHDLTGITVVAASDWRTDGCAHPGTYSPEAKRVDGGLSPVELTIDAERTGFMRWEESLWVHSPGYAWGRIKIDHASGGQRRVELHRGGTLEVRVEGRLPRTSKPPKRRYGLVGDDADEPRLRVRRSPEKPDLEAKIQEALARLSQMSDAELGGAPRPTEGQVREMFERANQQMRRGEMVLEAEARLDAPVVLKGVVPGTYVLAVELGNHWDSPLVLGETTAVVEVGRTQYATVLVEPPPERTTVLLAGTFFLPPAWDDQDISLKFEPMDLVGKTSQDERDLDLSGMRPDPARAGLYHWDAGLVVPGRYEVASYGLDMQWVVDTGPNGNTAAEIVVGAPVDVSVRVLEEATGEWLEAAQVLWNGERPEGVMGGLLAQAEWNAATKTYEFRAAAGRIEVGVHDRDYSPTGRSVFDVRPDNRELLVHVRRDCGVVLLLKDGQNAVPWEESTHFDVRISTLEGAPAGWGSGGSGEHGRYLKVRKPGTYRITIPEQPGFEPVPPIEIHIAAGTFVDREVQLQRRR